MDTYASVGREWYHLHNEVWGSTGLSVGSGFLCIGCLEERLGRRLTPADFDGYDPDPRDSPRLRNRRDAKSVDALKEAREERET